MSEVRYRYFRKDNNIWRIRCHGPEDKGLNLLDAECLTDENIHRFPMFSLEEIEDESEIEVIKTLYG